MAICPAVPSYRPLARCTLAISLHLLLLVASHHVPSQWRWLVRISHTTKRSRRQRTCVGHQKRAITSSTRMPWTASCPGCPSHCCRASQLLGSTVTTSMMVVSERLADSQRYSRRGPAHEAPQDSFSRHLLGDLCSHFSRGVFSETRTETLEAFVA